MLLTIAISEASPATAQSTPSKSKEAVATRIPSGQINIDGRLDETAWSRAATVTDFVQKEPVEGVEPTERTEVRFVYDDGGLYVGARMSSSRGRAGVQAPLSRRDSP